MYPPGVFLIWDYIKFIISFGDTIDGFVAIAVFLVHAEFVRICASDSVPAQSDFVAAVKTIAL